MIQIRPIIAFVFLAAIAPMVSQAQERSNRFKLWDANDDGKLTRDELPVPARQRFSQMDSDRDGVISRSEMAAFLQRRSNDSADADKRSSSAVAENSEVPPGGAEVPGSSQRLSGRALPTFGDVHYGKHERHLMDVWLADSEVPTPVLVSIHGGGFSHGNKSVEPLLLQACLKSGISVVAITYRLSQDAIAPAQFHDAARAVQFIRHHAKQWNIDPERIAATGGSAGAGISLWLGFHDDLAEPNSNDPVQRQSSRLTCMAVSNGQTSYDPRFIRELFPEDDQVYRIDALRQLFDADLDKLDQLPREKLALFEEVSPIKHLTQDDAPALLTYLVKDSERDVGIHSPRFGHALKKEMDKLGIRCDVVTHIDRDDPQYAALLMKFFLREFGMMPASNETAATAGPAAGLDKKGRIKPNGEYYAPPAMAERVDSQLKIGDVAPDFSLERSAGGEKISLAQFRGKKPVVLVFGSITCSPFRQSVMRTFELQKRYADKAEFLMIYIREAHPESTILIEENGVSVLKQFIQTDSIEARRGNAQSCGALLKVPFPMLIDTEDNRTLNAYGAWPIRLVVVGKDGRIAWDSGEGPRGFRPEKLEQWLRENL